MLTERKLVQLCLLPVRPVGMRVAVVGCELKGVSMLDVYREILPDSYLLILTDVPNAPENEALRRALHRAGTSGKASVWIDCSQLHNLPASALQLLGAYYENLRHRHIQLVLCHLTDGLCEAIEALPGTQRPPVVATLLEAACYCRSQRGGVRRTAIAA